jgi:hypothetical protein
MANDGYGVSPPWFRNTSGQEVTVRIDSKVIEDIEAGGTKDDTRRLRSGVQFRNGDHSRPNQQVPFPLADRESSWRGCRD